MTVMTGQANAPATEARWGRAFAIAAAGHAAALGAVLLFVPAAVDPKAEPVMVVELPPLPPGQAEATPVSQETPPDLPVPQPEAASPIDAPQIRMPVPADAVTVPPKPVTPPTAAAPTPVTPSPVAPTVTAAVAPAPQSVAQTAVASASIGDDPRAKKAEANYYQILMAYLARRKDYPAEARQARQQGVVTVRFTIDAQGTVSGEAIKRGSGFVTLDEATLRLLHRVSPVPPIPREMHRDTITISLPIEYSLTTK